MHVFLNNNNNNSLGLAKQIHVINC
jgi:hypothetical protein